MIIEKSKIVSFNCKQMYNLVNDVEKYSHFLPFCKKCFIDFNNNHCMKATIIISAYGLQQSFTTINNFILNKMIIINLIDGPFKYFFGFWSFKEIQKKCKISFFLEFSLLSENFLLHAILKYISTKIVSAFYKRAHIIYDK